MTRPLLVAALLAASPALLSAQEQQPRNCVIDIDSVGRFLQRQVGAAQVVFAGGAVRAHCRGEQTTMVSDSAEWSSGTRILRLIGNAHFRDSVETLDADRLTYWTAQEHLYAEGHVFARNIKDNSDLRGPNLDYYRAVPPIRDTLELMASGRPTIRLMRGDSTNPFVILADRVRLHHTNRFWGSGRVTIDRRDLSARADSSRVDMADSLAWLVGSARVVGRDSTLPPGDTTPLYTLVGQRIRFDLGEGQNVKRVRSFHDADARGADWRLTADTIDMDVDSNRIQRARAWGRERRPVAVSGLSTIVSDSMDILLPGQVMRQVWAYRAARAVSRSDTTRPEEDWITGDSLRATFVRSDSAGRARSDVDRVDAYGSARALYHTDNAQDRNGPRGINYSRGLRIDIALHDRKVRTVDIVGQVDGVYLEPMPDTTHADSTRADSLRPDSTRPATVRPDSTPRPRAPTAPTRPGDYLMAGGRQRL